MNRSGEALRDFDHLDPQRVVVVYDDIDLPYGEIKLSRNKGSGGHNGVTSIATHLHTQDFVRVRIGVCPRDWFGNPRKPRGRQAVIQYLTNRSLSRRYLEQERDIARRVVLLVESLVEKGYETTVSQNVFRN